MIAKSKANPELLAKLRRINTKLQRCATTAPHDYGYLLSVRDALLARIHAANIAQGAAQ